MTTPMIASAQRRHLLKVASAAALSLAVPASGRAEIAAPVELSTGALQVLSDGHLSLPFSGLFGSEQRMAEAKELLHAEGLSTESLQPPLNISLWQSQDRTVLFDVGSGSQFMESAGMLPTQLEEAGIDPADVTDVVFTHAHPDHCWGLLDDFDELLCPEATYHMHGREYDYWMSEDTLNNTSEAGLGMVAGARNRLPLIESRLERFEWGDELIPGIEAIDTHGHTPGHTSFAIHAGNDSVLVVGDALIHPVLSFQRPEWEWRSDLDPDAAVSTRKRLLERLAADKMSIVAYHLPAPGYGRVEKMNSHYQFVTS